MRLIVDHSALRTALQFAATATAKSATLPILACVLLRANGDELRVTSTNLKLTANTALDAAVRESGACVVNLEQLSSLCRNCAEPITLHAHDGKLDIAAGKLAYQIFVLPEDHFPTPPDLADAQEPISMSASTLLPMMRACSYAMSPEETRFQLHGVLFEFARHSLATVATDGHRMAACETDLRSGIEACIMVPELLVNAAEKLAASPDGFDVSVSWNDAHFSISLGRDSLIGRRPDVRFPQWREEVDRHATPQKIVTDTTRLLTAIKAVLPVARSKGMQWDFATGRLSLSSTNAEIGVARDEIAIDYSGPDVTIGLDGHYVADALATIHTTRVELGFSQPFAAVSIVPYESEAPFTARHIIMPMRLD